MRTACYMPGVFAVAVLCLLAALGCRGPADEKVVRVAYVSGPTELVHKAAEQFAGYVAGQSGGRLRVKLYPSGQLGNERVIVEGLKLRSVDMVITGAAIIGWYAPEYGVIEAPFVWRDYGHVDTVWRGEIGGEIRAAMRENAGIDMLHLWYRGPRYLSTTEKPVHHPGDLAGMKLRVPELEVYIKSWQTFGANVTPLPFNDMFMALKLGVVEGQENPLATIYGNNLHEVQKYIMETRHLIGFYILSTGPYFDRTFTQEERDIILGAAQQATEWHNRELERSEDEYKRRIKEAGVEFLSVDRDAFLSLAREQIPAQFSGVWKEGLYKAISETP